MNNFIMKTWAEINLDNLYHNIKVIQNNMLNKTKIMAVVKADGYGHGDWIISKELNSIGIKYLAVSNLDEAISLRQHNILCDILILGFTPPSAFHYLQQYNITQTVFSLFYAQELSKYACLSNCSVNIHIKIDTGMGRLGLIENMFSNCLDEVIKIYKLQNLNIAGIFSHFSSADLLDEESANFTITQKNRFAILLSQIKMNNIDIPLSHIENSAGLLKYHDDNFSYARAGIALYGVSPIQEYNINLKPLMSLKSVVAFIKIVHKGTSISYGRKFIADKDIKVATIPIGYADGYPRALSDKGFVLINGQIAPIIGTICMDQLMVDVTSINNIKSGDIVTLIGSDGKNIIRFEDISKLINCIPYETMCLVGKRVPRVYYKNGKKVEVTNYIHH